MATCGRSRKLRRRPDRACARRPSVIADDRSGKRLGEALLIDALRRVVDAAGLVGCTGVIVDAKDEAAERFYARYDFVTITAESWPRRMFLPIATATAAFAEP